MNIETAGHNLMAPATGPAFDPAELEGLPEPVRRYFNAAIAPGTAAATSVTLGMRGQIKVGRWLPFQAEEVLAPHKGFLWRARTAGVISGFDSYADHQGAMQWKILGLIPMVRADGEDVSKSAAGRCGAEAIWLPTALLPRFGVRWKAPAPYEIVATFKVDTTPIELRCRIASDGRVTSVVFDRWGDPDKTGKFGWHPFGGEITGHRTFNGMTVPSAGTWGWFHRTKRSQEGEFFRCRITGLEPS